MRKIINTIARGVFTLGGLSAIIIIIFMLLFSFKEIIPLFGRAKITNTWSIKREHMTALPVLSFLSEDATLNTTVFDDGTVMLTNTTGNEILDTLKLVAPITKAIYKDNRLLYCSNYTLYSYPFKFAIDAQTGLEIGMEIGEPSAFDIPVENTELFCFKEYEEEKIVYAVAKKNMIYYSLITIESNFWGEPEYEIYSYEKELETEITGLLFYTDDSLLAATADGRVNVYDEELEIVDNFRISAGISIIGQLIGDRGICVGAENGELTIWAQANLEGQGKKFFKIHTMPRMDSEIKGFSFSDRDRTFIAWSESGTINVYHSTTEKRRLSVRSKLGYTYALNAKGNFIIGYNDKENTYMQFDNPHPDISFGVLFGKVWYEGYADKTYSWQSTGGTNEFEPKYSLIPLIFGTIKGALYAMLFALPLALSGAIFMNQFLHSRLQKLIKPVIEIMAGLPSVIIGFLAGLWLAPLLENVVPGVLLGIVLIPFVIYMLASVIERISFFYNRDSYKYEIFFLIPLVLLVFFVSVKLTPVINFIFFKGDFKQFLFDVFKRPYDQRNAVVVGFAMGFAVIPLIFTLIDDALSFIPKGIISGSLALGLSRWQTATGVALKAAMPGILSAVMLGFGRAIGETMIVLMATGNTPIISWFPFNGFRTMSANIAVELPEAPKAGSVYRILFLQALLLFVFTFVINLLTDLLRKRMQKRFK